MKTLTLSVLAICVALGGYSQQTTVDTTAKAMAATPVPDTTQPAKSEKGSAVTLKPAVGVNFTDLSKNPQNGEYKGKAGYQIGASVAFGRKFYIEPGIFFVKKSSEFTSNTSQINDSSFDVSGIRIPVAVGVNLIGKPKSTFGVRVLGGASAFFLTGTDGVDKDDLKSSTFGVFAGLGIDISMFFIEGQYEWSVTDFYEDAQNAEIGKSRSVFINAGVRIRL